MGLNNFTTSTGVAEFTDVEADSINANSVSTDQLTTTNVVGKAALSANQSIASGSVTQVALDTNQIEDTEIFDVDLTNDKIIITKDGKYTVTGLVTFEGSQNFSVGDRLLMRLNVGGTKAAEYERGHTGHTNPAAMVFSVDVDVTSNADVLLSAFQKSGSGEAILGNTNETYLSVARWG